MAKEFAKPFYHSAAWKNARNDYLKRRMLVDAGRCELCRKAMGTEVHHKTFLTPENISDPAVSLNPENFELLCYDCHKLRHDAARRIAYMAARERDGKNRILMGGRYYVDEQGCPQPFRCIIVWGSPGAGKSTYIREHMQPEDMVIDLDLLAQALGMAGRDDVPGNIRRTAMDVRDWLYEQVAKRAINARCVWIAAGLPRKQQRLELIKRLDAEAVYIPSDISSCYQHALADNERTDKAFQVAIIDRWWKSFEPD